MPRFLEDVHPFCVVITLGLSITNRFFSLEVMVASRDIDCAWECILIGRCFNDSIHALTSKVDIENKKLEKKSQISPSDHGGE
jgi:hypothetical protein